jgi:YbbR domain-containing protein
LISKERTIRPIVSGEPALGFQRDLISIGDSRVVVSGPESLVNQVSEVRAEMDISGARESITKEAPLVPVDQNGQRVTGVTLEPNVVTLFQSISQSGGYRDVAVKVETVGQVASGYRLTSISVYPPTVTVFSSNPELVAEMPGFVSTQPLDLTEANDDIETHLVLDLPEGVTFVSEEQTVEVQVGIAAIESSISLQIPVSIVGLGSGLSAEISPETVDVIISGPTLVLEQLKPADIVIVVNLADLGAGTHLVVLQAVTIPERVVIDAIVPESVEVTISIQTTPPAGITPTPTVVPSP